jgi:phage terminase large subunit
MPEINVDFELPPVLFPLLKPARAKVLYGGRDGVKSWSVARLLLVLGTQRKLRILCARETQQSIRESVHQLLSDQIERLHLKEFYRVLQSTIIGVNKSEFIFVGLRNLTVQQIKSFEDIDIVWIEEAAAVTRRSWQVLIPTIRKPGSEIWVTFNPELATDDTYLRWVLRPPPNTLVIKTSYRDNVWLSAESRAEIEYLRETDPEAFEHIYEGATRSTVQGAIYKAQIMKAETEGRICRVPYDANHPVQTFWDLGWSDLVCIWFAQCVGFEYRLIDYHEDNFQDIDHYLQVLQGKGYTYSQCVLPWDASSRMMQNSIREVMARKGFQVRILERESVTVGIDAVRRLFGQMFFDADKCADGLSGLRRYQWGPEPKSGKTSREPLHDRASHPADALRTLAMSIKVPPKVNKPKRQYEPVQKVYAPFG